MQPATFDITPSPRVLRMLGQIDFAPWQCLAELIDNSIDAFLEGSKGVKPLTLNPQIDIELPSVASLDNGTGVIIVRDNGPGMTEDELNKAVTAGYSGNDPVEKLGLFGMGFNISTARLGKRTEVWTTTAESADWIGVDINFETLEKIRSFEAPRLQRGKSEEELLRGHQGTMVRISNLDPTRVRSLIWGRGKAATRGKLGKVYSRVIDQLGIAVLYDGETVRHRRHCTWNRKRSVPHRDFGNIPAIIDINEVIGSRRFCDTCWVWLEPADETCPACGTASSIRERQRSVKGWIGVQRYFDKEHFGIDLIRNGRVIEELDKSLFNWVDPDTSQSELEYPVDTTHWGGRIVGELEIDFVRVSHQKDAFDKFDPQWKEVVERVRGSSPMRPQIARRLGLPRNTSPLARLFAGYRSGNPAGLAQLVPGKPDGGGRNDDLKEWTEYFYNGTLEYQEDDKWYDLVLLAERGKRGGKGGGGGVFPPPTPTGPGGANPTGGAHGPIQPRGVNPTGGAGGSIQPPLGVPDGELSQTYKLGSIPGAPTVFVSAKRVEGATEDPPFFCDTAPNGGVVFQYKPDHDYFEESLATPVDCLVSDLTHKFFLLSGQSQRDLPLAMIDRKIREEYFPHTLTTVAEATEEARSILDGLRQFLDENLHEVAPIPDSLLDEHTLDLVRKGILEATLGGEQAAKDAIRAGEFIRYVGTDFLISAPSHWPEIVLDGCFVSVPYHDVSPSHQADSVAMVCDALRDAAWIISNAGGGAISKDQRWRLRFARALSSIRLLESWRS